MNEIINLRTAIREVDVSQVQGYKRRVILTDDVTITGSWYHNKISIIEKKVFFAYQHNDSTKP